MISGWVSWRRWTINKTPVRMHSKFTGKEQRIMQSLQLVSYLFWGDRGLLFEYNVD